MTETMRFKVLELIVVNGSETDKKDPLTKANEWLAWVEIKKKPGRPKNK